VTIFGMGHDGSKREYSRWAKDSNAPPHLDESTARVTVGQDWMRLNMPDEWATLCGARIMSRPLAFDEAEWIMVCNAAKHEVGFGAKNGILAAAVLRHGFELYRGREWLASF